MAQNSKSIPEWIEESIQEKIDDICYMSTLKDRVIANEEKLKKEIDILRDDLTIKDLEMGKMMNKINKQPETSGKKWVQGYKEWKKQDGKKT